MAILTLRGHFHLMWLFVMAFLPCMDIFTSQCHFSPCMAILTLHGHFYLTWPFSPCVDPHFVCSPPGHQKSCCMHPNMREQASHLACILCAPLHMKIIFFTSHGKNSPKNHEATSIPSIRYLYKPPIKFASRYFLFVLLFWGWLQKLIFYLVVVLL